MNYQQPEIQAVIIRLSGYYQEVFFTGILTLCLYTEREDIEGLKIAGSAKERSEEILDMCMSGGKSMRNRQASEPS